MRVLIIEDDLDIATNLYEFLEGRGCVVDMARDGVSGMHLAVSGGFDAIVLDLGLPGMDGLRLCSKLRREACLDVPVLILTARDVLDDKLTAFDCGADDYLVKPFALREVEARLKALVARRRGRVVNRKMVHGAIAFDPGNMAVSVDGRPVHLSRKCLLLLEMMMSAPNFNGCCSAGEQKQLSTASQAPASWAISASARMSLTSVSGLDGDSMKKSLVFGFTAARHSAGSVGET